MQWFSKRGGAAAESPPAETEAEKRHKDLAARILVGPVTAIAPSLRLAIAYDPMFFRTPS